MKRKINRRRIRIRPMRGQFRVMDPSALNADNDLIEFIGGMGYLIYEEPTDENLLIITDRVMTYRDYFKSRMCVGCKVWFRETYGDRMNEELNEYNW